MPPLSNFVGFGSTVRVPRPPNSTAEAPPIPDGIAAVQRTGKEWPLTDLSGCNKVDAAMKLFDHLVGAGQQCRWHGEAECFGGLEVDYQPEYRGLLNGKIGWLRTF